MSGRLTRNEVRSVDEPTERLTALCAHMLRPLEVEPDVRAVVLLDTGDRGGMVHHGYGEDADVEVVVTLLGHAEALLAARGIALREALDTLTGPP